MTRKKQDAPKKLNGEFTADRTCSGNTEREIVVENLEVVEELTEKSSKVSSEDCQDSCSNSSCDKLLAFTMEFLSNKAHSFSGNTHKVDASHGKYLSNTRTSSASPNGFPQSDRRNHPVSSTTSLNKNSIRLPLDAAPVLNGLDKLPFKDVASINAAQCVMDAMLQQQHLYEQCSSNWINVQRNDNNCLSKSKAERYRWCVQGNNHKLPRTANGAHVPTVKKPTSNVGSVQDKLFGTVFAGASKFNCRDCGSSFNTLVELTVHMNQTGHFRDKNSSPTKTKVADDSWFSNVNKTKKKTSEKESNSEKVLTCMGCGGLFDSLQDLSVHMIKTKHYEKVPSWRMWSPKPEASENSARRNSTNHVPGNADKKSEFPSSPDISSLINSQFYFPFLGAMTNPAAYSLLYSTPWITPFLPSMMNSLYPFPLTPRYPAPTSDPGIPCPECSETFTSLQELTNHFKETSHFTKNIPSQSSPLSQHESANMSALSKSPQVANGASECDDQEGMDEVGGSDFIKSLESTIQNAISKVEGRSPAPKNFAPFTSSLKAESPPVGESPKHRGSFKPPTKSESPLDLTVKREDCSPKPPNEEASQSVKESSAPIKSSPPFLKKNAGGYQPLIDGKLPSNPLEEMWKIVHNTTTTSGRKRSSSDVDAGETPQKRNKTLDLVIPGDSPVINPIQQMQDLVNKKINAPKSYCGASSPLTTSSSVPSTCSPVTSLNAFVTSSRFLPHTSPQNRLVNLNDTKCATTSHNGDVSSERKKVPSAQLTRNQEILLHRCYAHLMTSNPRHQHLSGDAIVAIASAISLPRSSVEDWMERANERPPFIRIHGDRKEVFCAFCSPYKILDDVMDLAEHLQRHLEPESTSFSSKQKIHFQGSMCFSTFRQNVPSTKADDVKAIIRNVDDVTTPDDVIRVTG